MIKLESCRHSPDRSGPFSLAVDTLAIARGQRVCVVGPSGSGKTTLLKVLAGLLPGCSGRLSMDGRAIPFGRPDTARGVMYLAQDAGLWPHLNCVEHLAFVLSKGRSLRHERARSWLDLVGLENQHDSRPRRLSGGEKKRLALARALAAEPRYLFLDEPFANIDLVQAEELMGLIDEQQRRQGFSLITVTHHSFGLRGREVLLLVIEGGRIIQRGTLAEIMARPINRWTEQWLRLVA